MTKLGYKQTEEAKQNMRRGMLGVNKGRKLGSPSLAHRQKNREGNLGKHNKVFGPPPEERRKRISETMLAKKLKHPHTEESKRRISASKTVYSPGDRSQAPYGYVKIKLASGGFKQEHRLVVEKHLERPLDPSELVHHMDECRTNNVITNLQLTTRKEHPKLHAKLTKVRKNDL